MTENTYISPFKSIFLMFNMVKSDNIDLNLFHYLDKNLNLNVLKTRDLMERYVYGALFSYYSLNIGKAENLTYFETLLESKYLTIRNFLIF